MSDKEDYEVGYCKPPKHTQWKPGQSGNPKGRPKRVKDFERLLERELGLTLQITEGGRHRTLTKRELIIKRLVTDAVKGDHRSLKLVVSFMKDLHLGGDFELDAGDREALNALFERFKKAENGHG